MTLDPNPLFVTLWTFCDETFVNGEKRGMITNHCGHNISMRPFRGNQKSHYYINKDELFRWETLCKGNDVISDLSKKVSYLFMMFITWQLGFCTTCFHFVKADPTPLPHLSWKKGSNQHPLVPKIWVTMGGFRKHFTVFLGFHETHFEESFDPDVLKSLCISFVYFKW